MENIVDLTAPSVNTSLYATANVSTYEINTSRSSELADSILALGKPNSRIDSNEQEQSNGTVCTDSSSDMTSSSVVELSKSMTPIAQIPKGKSELTIDERSFSVVIDEGGLNTSSEEGSEVDLAEEGIGAVDRSNFNHEEGPSALPDTVTILTTPDGGLVYLVGTAHFSKESQDDVAKVIRAVQPHVVLVELCGARVNILQLDEQTILEEAKNINIEKIKSTIQQNGFFHGIMNILLLSLSAHLTKELGMAPGGEFRQAFSEAKKVPNCVVHLGDRPIKLTIQRALSSLTWWQTLKLSWHIMAKESISKEQVERCKQRDLLEEMLEQLTGEFPALSRVFVAERDLYLANSLQLAALPIPCPSTPLVACFRIHTSKSGWCSWDGSCSWNFAALGKSGSRCYTCYHEDSSAFTHQSSSQTDNKSFSTGSICLGMCQNFAIASYFKRNCSWCREFSEDFKDECGRPLSVTITVCMISSQWIALHIWSLFTVCVIMEYFLMVLWVTNEDFGDILTEFRIQDRDAENFPMTWSIFLELTLADSSYTYLSSFYIFYNLVISKINTVIKYFGNNKPANIFLKQSLFYYLIISMTYRKCENHSKMCMKYLICYRKQSPLLKKVKFVIYLLCANRNTTRCLEMILFSIYLGKDWYINLKRELSLPSHFYFNSIKILLETMIIFKSFSLVLLIFLLCFLKIMKNITLSCKKKRFFILCQNYLMPQFYEKYTIRDKIVMKSTPSKMHVRIQLGFSDAMKQSCVMRMECSSLMHELGMKFHGNGNEKKGSSEMKSVKYLKIGYAKHSKVLRRVVGGTGSGGGRDDEDSDAPNVELEDKRDEDSSHEEEIFEKDMDESIDNYCHPLPNIFYVTTNVPGPGADSNDFESVFQGCDCAANQNNICYQNCLCVLRSMGPNYDDGGLLLPEKLSGNIPIFECSEYCACSCDCGNRKVQFGPMTGLTIFETNTNADVFKMFAENSYRLSSDSFKLKGKGLGIRLMTPVSKGNFICEYAGEIIGREEAFERWKNDHIQGHPNYILALQEWISLSQSKDLVSAEFKSSGNIKTEECTFKSNIVTYIDPTRVGNIGRYANHSCDPNAVAVSVRVGSPIPRLCLFAIKDIMSGEEVTFDYAGPQIALPSEIFHASEAEEPHVEEKNCSSSVSILLDLQSNVLKEKYTSDSIVEGNYNDCPELENKHFQNQEIGYERKLCLCGTKICRKYLPFSMNWI